MDRVLIGNPQFPNTQVLSQPLDGFWELMFNHGMDWGHFPKMYFWLISASLLIVSVGAFYVFDRRQKRTEAYL